MKTENDLRCPKCGAEHTTKNPGMTPGSFWTTANIYYEQKADKCEAICLRCGHEWTE